MDSTEAVTENSNVSSPTEYYYYYGDTTYQTVDLYVILIGLFGIIDNTLVAVVIFWFTKMKSRSSGLLILNQTLVDLATCSLLALNYTVFYTYGYYPGSGWKKLWSEIYCRVFLTEWLQWGMMLSSTVNLVVFNLERYLSVVHPIRHKGLTKKKFAYPALVFIWISGPVYCLLWAFPSSYMEDGWCMLYAFKDNVDWSTAYGFTWVTFNYFIPLGSMLYFYSHMMMVLKRSNFKRSGEPSGGVSKPKMSRTQKSLLKTAVLITLAFVACMTWDNINWLLYTMGKGAEYTNDVYYYSYLLSSFNSCINPFIYLVNHREFQAGAKRMFCRGRIRPAALTGGVSVIGDTAVTSTSLRGGPLPKNKSLG